MKPVDSTEGELTVGGLAHLDLEAVHFAWTLQLVSHWWGLDIEWKEERGHIPNFNCLWTTMSFKSALLLWIATPCAAIAAPFPATAETIPDWY